MKYHVVITDENGIELVADIEAPNLIEAGIIAEQMFEDLKTKEGEKNE